MARPDAPGHLLNSRGVGSVPGIWTRVRRLPNSSIHLY
jgi:hypothetical protein